MERIEELNLTECIDCKEKKVRIVSGYWGKNKKCVDEHNRLWSGKRCPLCNNKRIHISMTKMRARRKVILNEVTRK